MADLRTKIGYAVIGTVVGVCTLGFAIIMGFAGTNSPGIIGQTIGYRVASDTSVVLTFRIAKPEDALVTCTARALSKDAAVVAQQEVTAKRGKKQSTQMITMTTTGRAAAAEIRDCRRS